MKRIFLLITFIMTLTLATACSATPLTNMSPADFAKHCNEISKEPDGVFLEPQLVPQLSDDKESMYVAFVYTDKVTCLISFYTDSTNAMHSIKVTSIDDQDGIPLALNISTLIARGLGLNDAEMKNIYGNIDKTGDYQTDVSATGDTVYVKTRVDTENKLFGIIFTDK